MRRADLGLPQDPGPRLTRLRIREATPEDAETCGRIIDVAFGRLYERHGFPLDFASAEDATAVARFLIGHPSVFGVVAEADGRVVGSNFLDERDPISGVGPVTIDPDAQGRGIGRALMEAVLDRGRDTAGIRLLQDTFNTGSLALYASLGFEVKEPVALVRGRPRAGPPAGVEVRPLEAGDIEECSTLCRAAHGFARANELLDASGPVVVLRDGRLTGYATVSYTGHGVAESEQSLRALIIGAAALTQEPVSFLLPTRESSILRWCLAEGFRVIKPMTLMTLGAYQEPRGSWFPSVWY